MSILLTIIAFIVIFSILILIHELGHFVAAKRAGIRVDEFGFGLPPRIWGKKIGETIYSINAFPFGGFVRLYGEDAHEEGVLKNKKSFAGKTLRQRIWVVVAGVLMNFFLAIFLLTIGFSFGIQPLLVGAEDVFQAIEKGQMQIQSGIVLASVQKDSLAEQFGFQKGDTIVQLNGNNIIDFSSLESAFKNLKKKDIQLRMRRDPSFYDIKIPATDQKLGLEFYDNFALPRVTVSKVDSQSEVARSGILAGDVILEINGKHVYNRETYQDAFNNGKKLIFTVLRDFREMNLEVSFPHRRSVVFSEVLSDSAATKAGLQKNDRLVQINHQDVEDPQGAIRLISQHKGEQIQLLIDRSGQLLTFYIVPDEEGRVGVMLSPVEDQNSNMEIYISPVPTSVLKIEDVQYGFWKSLGHAFQESYRLALATVHMFAGFVGDFFSQFRVPEGVAGPVGIAQMTGVFVQEGFLSLLRFTALLSLSLAVMNLLPFPGLDGGRLLFLVIEGVRGKPLRARAEQTIHTVGFVLLVVMILAVTYKDILRLFQ